MLKDVVNITRSFLLLCHCKLVALVLKTARWLPPPLSCCIPGRKSEEAGDVERQKPPYKTWPFIREGKLLMGTSYISLARRVQHGYL